jgi:hypothetical protein
MKTLMRVRIKNRETVYVSQEFKGVINRSQFKFKENQNLVLLTSEYNDRFYGSIPLELDSLNPIHAID